MNPAAEFKPIRLHRPANQAKPVTLAAPFGRWDARHGEIDADPGDSGLKLRTVLIPN